jgi:hypothetical protein
MTSSTGLDSTDDATANPHDLVTKVASFPWLSAAILGLGGLATILWLGFLFALVAMLLWTLI